MKKSQLPEGYFSPQLLMNGLVFRKFDPYTVKAWRGESKHSGSGLALLGIGYYSSTSKSYARRFGIVREVNPINLPSNPIRFKSELWLRQWEHDLRKTYGEEWLKSKGYFQGVIKLMGFDGVTVGTGKDMIICKYQTISSR